MNIGKYDALDKNEVRQIFMDYIDALNMPIIDYFAIGVQDTIWNTSTSMMSRLDWQETFTSLNLHQHDPIRKASFNAKSAVFSFDEVDYQDSLGKEVMRQRRLHEIENGLVIIKKNLGHNFMLTLATGYKNFSSYRFYVDHHQAIARVFSDLIHIVSCSTRQYQKTVVNHPGVCAK